MKVALSNSEENMSHIFKHCFADLTQTHSPGQDPKVFIYFHLNSFIPSVSQVLAVENDGYKCFSFQYLETSQASETDTAHASLVTLSPSQTSFWFYLSFSDHYMYVFGGYEEIIERFAIFVNLKVRGSRHSILAKRQNPQILDCQCAKVARL